MAAGSIRFLYSGVLLMLALAAVTLEAGGWAVITVRDVPHYVVVGELVTLRYTVRQHGKELLNGLVGRIEARAGKDVVKTPASPASEPGQYLATLELPHAGSWTIDVISGFPTDFGASRLMLRAIDPGRPAPAVSEAERGRRLFAAKGCVTCHVHGAVEGRSVSASRELTDKRYQPEYLMRFLAHPPQAKPGGEQMPDLKLHDKDITSLVAFINAEQPASRVIVRQGGGAAR